MEADVPGVCRGQQPGLENERAEGERGLRRREVQRGQRDQVPQRAYGIGALAVAREPVAEGRRLILGVGARAAGSVQTHESDGGTRGSQALSHGQVPIARQRPREVQRRRQRAAPQHDRSRSRLQHRYLQARLQPDELVAAEPAKQRAIGEAAAQEDVLAVVHLEAVALEGVGRAPQPAPDLDHGRTRAGGGAVERGGDASEASADDHDATVRDGTIPAHRAPPTSIPRAATHAFSCVGSDTRRRIASSGRASIRSSSLR